MSTLLFTGLSLVALLVPGGIVYDSGNPVPRAGGDVAFMDVWRVLDPLDNLSVRVVVPIGALDGPARVTAFEFYAFNPKDPADKVIEIYRGTGPDSAGTLHAILEFPEHAGVRQGWTRFVLEQPLVLEPGRYGISFHAQYEFHSYWAGNAPNGEGYAWVRPNDEVDWFKCGADDFGFAPNFGMRIYGKKLATAPRNGSVSRDGNAGVVTPGAAALVPGSSGGGGFGATGQPKNAPGRAGQENAPDMDVAGNPHEYPPGARTEVFHVVWRKDLALSRTGTQPR